jgi:hypothetical protein
MHKIFVHFVRGKLLPCKKKIASFLTIKFINDAKASNDCIANHCTVMCRL